MNKYSTNFYLKLAVKYTQDINFKNKIVCEEKIYTIADNDTNIGPWMFVCFSVIELKNKIVISWSHVVNFKN